MSCIVKWMAINDGIKGELDGGSIEFFFLQWWFDELLLVYESDSMRI